MEEKKYSELEIINVIDGIIKREEGYRDGYIRMNGIVNEDEDETLKIFGRCIWVLSEAKWKIQDLEKSKKGDLQ